MVASGPSNFLDRFREARQRLKRGEMEEARRLACLLRMEARRSRHRPARALALLLHADLLAERRLYTRGLSLAKRALPHTGEWRGFVYGSLARIFVNTGTLGEALRYARRAYFHQKRSGFAEEAGTALMNMAAAFANMGEEERAERYRARALDLAVQSGSKSIQGAVAFSRGTEALFHGRLDEAQSFLEDALRCYPIHHPASTVRINTQGNLALVAAFRGDVRRAMAMSAGARKAIDRRGGAACSCKIERNHVEILIELEDYDRALRLLDRQPDADATPYDLVAVALLKARLLFRMGELDQARRDLEAARGIRNLLKLSEERFPCDVLSAWADLLAGNFGRAFSEGEKLLEWTRQHRNICLHLQSAELLAHVALRQADFPQAIRFFETLHRVAVGCGFRPSAVRAGVELAGLHHVLGNHGLARASLLQAREDFGNMGLPVTGYVLRRMLDGFALRRIGDPPPRTDSPARIQRREAEKILARYGLDGRPDFTVWLGEESFRMDGDEAEQAIRRRGLAMDLTRREILAFDPPRPPRPLDLDPGSVSMKILTALLLFHPAPVGEDALWALVWNQPLETSAQMHCLIANIARLRNLLRQEGFADAVQKTSGGYHLAGVDTLIIRPAPAGASVPDAAVRCWIYAYLILHPFMTPADARRLLRLSASSIAHHLKEMIRQGVLQREGRGAKVRYLLRRANPDFQHLPASSDSAIA